MQTADGNISAIHGKTRVKIDGDDKDVYCTPLNDDTDIILGYDWMKETDATFDYLDGSVTFTNKRGIRKRLMPSPRAQRQLPKQRATTNDNKMSFKQFKRGLKTNDFESVYTVSIHEAEIHNLCSFETDPILKVTSDSLSLPPVNVTNILSKYPSVYPAEPKITGLPPPRKILEPAMKIDTGNAEPIKQRYYRLGPEELAELRKQLQSLTEAGLLRPSNSPWGSPVFFVKKKNGTYRMVIDYRKINAITKTDAYPLPRIQDSIERLGGAKFFSALDATSGFHQLPVRADDIEKTAINTRYGSFEFLVTPFGLKNSPSAFQRMMNEALGEWIDIFLQVYMDDILIYSATEEDHLKHLELISQRLSEYNIQINMQKSVFMKKEVVYCGYKIAEGKVTVDDAKFKILDQWPAPKNVSGVRSFLGFVGHYRKLIKRYAHIAAPLTDLTKKSQEWQWGLKEQNSFDTLIKAMRSSPVLTLPLDDLRFHIWPDASPFAVGGVLTQDQGQGHQPIAYEYHRLSAREEAFSQYEREALALLYCLRQWRTYFEGRPFTVHTDNSVILRLATIKDPHGRLGRWIAEFQQFSPDMEFTPGATHPADALSRLTLNKPITRPISEYREDMPNLELNEVTPIATDQLIIHSAVLATNINTDHDWPLLIAHYLETEEWLDGIPEELLEQCQGEQNHFEIRDNLFMRKRKLSSVPYLPYKARIGNMKRFHDGLGHLGLD